MNMRTRSSYEIGLYLILFLFGVFYVVNTWSPSSYGIFLQEHDPENAGVVWGKPRAIRSDEWAVVTPLTQATINNNFERYNKTSFYDEDLRINYGLPIYDWGMIFKPTMWGYLFLKPAMAYSLNWYLTFAFFIIGYFKLFNKIGLGRASSLCVSVSLYYSTLSQFWWDEKGPVLTFFPWVVWVLLEKIKPVPALIIFYWLSVSWLITDFYPPYIISLGFVGAILFLCFSHNWFSLKKISALAIATIAAVATAFFYLKDYLLKTSQTVYPGHRSIGGGSLNWSEWFSQFLPFSTFDKNFDVFSSTNISEIGAVGVPYLLMMLVHLNYKKPFNQILPAKTIVNLYFTLVALVLMNLWMLVPIPSWIGKVFLWDNVHPVRMKYAAGVMLTIVTVLISNYLNFTINTKRLFLYFAVIILGWFATKLNYTHTKIDNNFFHNIKNLSRDLYFIPGMILAYVLIIFFKQSPVTAFTFCSAIVSAVVIFPFNPIQSANAIFNNHPVIKNKIDPYVDSVNKVLAIPGYPGATLNGLGYKSVTHVTAVPALSIWKKMFPDMDRIQFQNIFNRYSHVHLANIDQPDSPQPDVIEIPFKAFGMQFYIPAVNNGKIIALSKDSSLSGIIDNLPSGNMVSFSPLIGNYNNSSKGILSVKVCNGSICQTREINLSKSSDNAYAPLFFKTPLKISADSKTTYEFHVQNSPGSMLVLWGSETPKANNLVIDNFTRKINLMPNLEVRYAK